MSVNDPLTYCGKLTKKYFKPWVTFSQSSERVVIPQPQSPTPSSRSSCPHEEQGLSDWHSMDTWPGGVIPQAGSNITLPANTIRIMPWVM